MRLYVATKFENALNAAVAMDRLTRAGHRITYDWTPEALRRLNDPDAEPRTKQEQVDIALDEVDGVLESDALILLWHEGMQGAWFESGIAAGQAIPVIVVGGKLDCIFEHLCFDARNLDEAIEILGNLQRDRA